MAKFQREDSKFSPLRGATYVELPDKLQKKGAIINMKNHNGVPVDNQCFKWATTRAVDLPHNEDRRNPQRIDKNVQTEAKKYNWTGINFPSDWEDV